jgi:hypothetical protein
MADEFLPGFRETRIPLAVGSLSVTAVALIVRHFLAALLDGELVGIVLHEVGGIVVQIVVAMLNLLPLAIALLALLLGVSSSAG